jgi:hypothetical protein
MKTTLSALMAASIACLSGCTVAGVVVGGQIPKTEAVAPPVVRGAEAREEIEVAFVDTTGTHVLTGEYGGSERDALLIESDGSTTRVPFDRISQLRVKRGSYWAEGMVTGFALDAAFVAVILVEASSPNMRFGGGHW